MLDPAGPVAERMADLWWIMLALGVLVFVVWTAFFLRAIRRGSSDEDDARPARGGYGSWFVVTGVAIPIVILAVVFVATVVAMQELDDEPPADALVVEIVGHQWWYEVRYPEAGVTTRNELHIPVGRPVAFRLTSADVIHSFWVPELGGKRDLLPDGVNTMVLTAERPGEFQNRCAEFCGLHHATMAMDVVAEPQAAFEDWIASR